MGRRRRDRNRGDHSAYHAGHMEVGEWYELDPPGKSDGKEFPLVRCEFRLPHRPNEYTVRGIPIGGIEPESFLLAFREDCGLTATLSEPPANPPNLNVVE